MENQEVYKIAKGVSEVTIIHRTALAEKAPIPVNITGNIDSVIKWIEKRVMHWQELPKETIAGVINLNLKMTDSLINQKEAYILINREKMTITLVVNELNPFLKGTVTGALAEHPDFDKWSINSENDWDHETLAEFIKMNRSSFKDHNTAMKLVTELKGLKVKVEKEIEKSNDNRGSYKAVLAQQVVASNIPEKFNLCVPVFKGQDKVEFQVEIYVNPTTFRVKLISPDVADIISNVRDTIIDAQKQQIEAIAPQLVIIEQ